MTGPDWMTAAERNDRDRHLAAVDDAVRRASQPDQSATGVCPRHDAPLFVAWLGGPTLVCRHCLEPVCEACEEPESLCTCVEPGA